MDNKPYRFIFTAGKEDGQKLKKLLYNLKIETGKTMNEIMYLAVMELAKKTGTKNEN